MSAILGWIAFGLAALRLLSIIIHAVFNTIPKDDTPADPSSSNVLLD